MYTRFIFGKAGHRNKKDQEVHEYGVFVDPLRPSDGNISELSWKTKLKINQARLVSKGKDKAIDMVALLPRSSFSLPRPSFTLKHDYDESLLPWDHLPRSFDLNFSAVDQETGDVLPQYSFPYFSSHFQAKSQLVQLETRLDPFSNARAYNFSDYFRHPTNLPLDFYAPEDIPKLLHFIPGQRFNSQEFDNRMTSPVGFFLLHIVSARVLVPVSHSMVLDLLERGLPGDTSLWSTILENMHDFSILLKNYYNTNFFSYKAPTHLIILTLLLLIFFDSIILSMTAAHLLTSTSLTT